MRRIHYQTQILCSLPLPLYPSPPPSPDTHFFLGFHPLVVFLDFRLGFFSAPTRQLRVVLLKRGDLVLADLEVELDLGERRLKINAPVKTTTVISVQPAHTIASKH